MSTKMKFWGLALVFIAFIWIFSSSPESDSDTQYPQGTVAANREKPQPAVTAENIQDLPSPMYAHEAMQQLIDTGAIHALKGVKLGKKKADPAMAPTIKAADDSVVPQKPATFPTKTIRFKTKRGVLPLVAGIAATPELQERGLMFYQTWPAQMHGLLFPILRDEVFNMWMKNTYLSLDMLFMDKAGTVVHIARQTATESEALISSEMPASYVLEIPAGAAKLWQIEVGDKLLLPLEGQ